MGLEQYITATKDRVNFAYKQIEDAFMEYDVAMKRLEFNEKFLNETGVKQEHEKIVQEYNDGMQKAIDTCRAFVEQQRTAFIEEVNEYYSPEGDRLDMNDMSLIKSGIRLTADELVRMIEKHSDNVTMLRIVDQYITDNRMNTAIAEKGQKYVIVLYKCRTVTNKLKKAFDLFVHLSCMGFAHPDRGYTRFQLSLNYYEAQALYEIQKARPVLDDELLQEAKTKMQEEDKKCSEALINCRS